MFVQESVAEYAVRLVLATRTPAAFGLPDLAGALAFGASPRASLGLVAAGRALALLRGRDYVLPADITDVAVEVIAHRLVLSFDALADGVDPRWVVSRVLAAVEPPRIAPSQGSRRRRGAAERVNDPAGGRSRLRRGHLARGRPRCCGACELDRLRRPARRPGARRLSRSDRRRRPRGGRGAGVRTGRGRRTPHGLGGHGAHDGASHSRRDRRPRAGDVAARRRHGQHGLRHGVSPGVR